MVSERSEDKMVPTVKTKKKELQFRSHGKKHSLWELPQRSSGVNSHKINWKKEEKCQVPALFSKSSIQFFNIVLQFSCHRPHESTSHFKGFGVTQIRAVQLPCFFFCFFVQIVAGQQSQNILCSLMSD